MTTIGSSHDRWAHHPRGWGWVLSYGVLLAVIGVLALLQPIAAAVVTGVFLAFVLIAGGIVGIIAGVVERGWQSRWLDLAVGTLSLLLGGAVVWNPFLGALSLIWAIGLWLIVCGILEISAAFGSATHRGWLIVLGVIDCLLGAYLLTVGTVDALVLLSIIIGLSFVMRGIFIAGFAFRLRGAAAI